MRFKVTGVREAVANMGRKVPAVMVDELGDALHIEGELIMTESKRDWVPVDIGTLRGSGFVDRPEQSGTRVKVTMGYGGAASAYALIQHERTDLNHPTGGRAKYLEGPTKLHAIGLGSRVARRIDMRRAAV